MRALVMATWCRRFDGANADRPAEASRDTNQSSLTDADCVAIQRLVAGAYALDTAADRGQAF